MYNLNYDKKDREDKEMAEMMQTDLKNDEKSKEVRRMVHRALIVSRYNKKFRLTSKTRKWNIQF